MKLTVFTHSMFARMLFSVTLVLSLLIALVSYALYYSFQRVTIESISSTSANYLLQTSYGAGYMNDNARNFALSIFANPNTNALMYNVEEEGVTELIMEMDRIQALVKANSFVHSVYVYNKKQHRFLSTVNSITNREDDFFDKEAAAMMQSPNAELRLKPIPRILSNDNHPKETRVLTYVIYDNYSVKGGVDGAVIVNIYSDYLQNLITSYNMGNPEMSGETFIVDANSHLITDAKNLNEAEISTLMGTISAQEGKPEGKAGYTTTVLKDEKVLVAYTKSEVPSWWFVRVHPYSVILKSTAYIKTTTLLISIVLFMLGLLLSFIVSRRLYSPFGKLVGRVRGLVDSPASRAAETFDEVELLNKVVSEAYALKRDSQQMQRNERLKSLFTPHAQPLSSLQALLDKYRITLQLDEGYVLISYRIDYFARFMSDFNERDRDLLRYAIGNAAGETVGRNRSHQVIDMGDDILMHIVNVEEMDGEELRSAFAQGVKELQEWCLHHLKLNISAAVGEKQEDFTELYSGYQKVVSLSQYRLVYGHGCLLFADMLSGRAIEASYKIEPAEEQQLYEALVGGRLDEARSLYAGIMSKVTQHSYDAMMSNILYLFYFVHNTMQTMERNSIDKYQLDFHAYLRQMSQVETMDEVHALFDDIFTEIASAITSRKNNRSSILMDSVLKYIETNYTDPGLCLDTVAAEMKLSKMYVGKLFREAYGQSVADYIVEVRMRRAIELLNEGGKNKTLIDILGEIGVENKKYFYILFKKKMGVSFSDYRLKHLNLVRIDEDDE
ncbi:AraC family transcriptional regulator [Paenibacillus eucommiae]|uniref:AraC-like DNA-binding protein n=1 Tax=Paenibacillus eucommiae TaxID=1355755 RepID=A0ABS4J1T6_9BACL|nr:helix-turn-helix domain-containing protein [Paenibacillus eucommiae]MBP1993802.1 AraC-like DNA-binding protein [Paenibacillus eucommiae]